MQPEYVFDNAWAQARERLGFLESTFDPGSIRHLEGLGVAEGWQCLEVGAGGGSIAAWLCARVGPTGHVLATDLDTRFLEHLAYPNLTVCRHDITAEPLPEVVFDLVHSRVVLMHLPERGRVLQTLIGALKPGGWLLVEEADSFFCPPDPRFARAPLYERSMAAWIQVQTAAGADWTYGRRLYSEVRATGLRDVEGEGRVAVVAAGTPNARAVQLSVGQLRERIVGAGLLSDADVDRLLALYDDPGLVAMAPTLMAVWGRKPTSHVRIG